MDKAKAWNDEQKAAARARMEKMVEDGRVTQREVTAKSLILQDNAGKREYEKMLADGWSVDSVTRGSLSRASTVVFSRPRLR